MRRLGCHHAAVLRNNNSFGATTEMKSRPLKRRTPTIGEHTQVVLKHSLPSLGLAAGTFGVVVHVYADSGAYEVEFLSLEGNTLGVATVKAGLLSPVLLPAQMKGTDDKKT